MKKGLIKAGLIGFLFLFLLGLITFSILSSAYSYSYEKTYYVGEGIHINLGEERAYVLRIISPEEEFVTKGSGESIYYLPKEPGIYKFYISYGGNLDKYTFHVIEKGKNQGNQNNITLNNSYSDNLFHAQTRERQLGRLNKEVIVYTENNLDQENVLADASVDEIIKIEEKDKIKLYWKEHKSYIDFEAEDKDEDGYIDKIQWIIPELNSEQTFEIILISKAEHLSSNKTFISDIYEQVQKLDNVWSETINSEEYVRATFEKNLTSSNDITIFPRIINGNPTVEVYEKDSNILIAEFENMIPNDYNKILLTNLQGSQNTFDLKVIGGSVEFDYIVDPSDYISCDEDSCIEIFNTTGSTTWQAPPGIKKVSVLAVGGGGGGSYDSGGDGGNGGGGGGLGLRDNIVVVPGNTYTVVVGVGGSRDTNTGATSTATSGGDSYFNNTGTVAGLGGGGATGDGGTGGGYVGTSGGNGGAGGNSNNPGNQGSGGAGGGGGAGGNNDAGGGGGGVGIYGEGANGAAGTYSGSDGGAGGGGSGGDDGGIWSGPANGGLYGGGGAGAENLNGEHGNGAQGAVVITYFLNKPANFTYIPPNASLIYGNESLGVDFDAEDQEEGIIGYGVNDTRFSINQTGFLTNATPLGVEDYLLNVSVIDSSNFINWTFYQVQVNKSTYFSCGVYFNTTSPRIYPDLFIVYTNCSSAHTLYMNGTTISNATTINSGIGYYNLTVQRTDTQNYTYTTDTKFFTVNKNTETCQVLFNETFPLESSSPFLVWANCSSPFTLYRNGTEVENNSEQILLYGTYNFSMLRTDNYNYSIYYNETLVLIDDTIIPFVDFGPSSPKNNSKFARDWIYVDASVVEDNEVNITYSLYYENYTTFNSSTYTDPRREINWTNVPEGIYYYNITVFDIVGHSNTTETRKIKLNFSIPSLNFIYPTEENGVSRSKNWIYVNVSASNVNNEINITFGLYNDSGFVNESTYTDPRREINWTNLAEGIYYYNITLFDDPDGLISTLTWQLTLDTENPNATLLTPENESYSNNTQQNLTLNATDNLGLSNITLFVYNETDLINETTQDISGIEAITGIVYNFLYDGIFKWFYKIFDLAGNSFQTENNTITIDTTYPQIDFAYPTEDDYANKSQNFIYVNVSVNETNEKNITFDLYDSNHNLLNSSTYTDPRREINWTSFPDGIYYYNATIVDLVYNVNYTKTRQIGLDNAGPVITIINPKPKSYGYNENLPLDYVVSDAVVGLDSCWWNLDDQANQSIPCGTNTTFDTSEGSHTLYFYSNDTLNHLSTKTVSFYISLTAPITLLTNPQNSTYLSYFDNIFLNYSASDPDGIDVCSLYGDWNGGWHENQTDPNWFTKGVGFFFDNFDDGDLGSNWTTYSSNQYSRITLRTDSSHSASYAVIADSSTNNQYELSELITAKDFTSAENIILDFWYREWTDENNAGADHSGHYNGEAVYFTCDGNYWYDLYDLFGTASWQNININISADPDFCSEVNSSFAIKFTQYDNFGLTSDGIGWDDINISYIERKYIEEANSSFSVNLPSDGIYLWNVQCNDTLGYIAFAATNNTFTIDTTYPQIDFAYPTEDDYANKSQNFIYVNVSVNETNEKNITFNLYYPNYTIRNSSTYTDKRRTINWTNLPDGDYYYNVSVFDYVNYSNVTETRKIKLDTLPPIVNLIYPSDYYNFSDYLIPFLNYSVNDTNDIVNCTLYGNWGTGWHANETTDDPQKETILNFSDKNVETDGYYLWNVLCIDNSGNSAFNLTNYTFAAFMFPDSPNSSLFNISQTKNDGTGEVFLSWNTTNHAYKYRVYYTENASLPFALLAETSELNYTDPNANQSRRRFYKIAAVNPSGENMSADILGKTVYYIKMKPSVNTRNWIGLYLKTNLTDAKEALGEISNITSFTMWNSTIQKRVTCNNFSCPDYPSCTLNNCNFNLEEGSGYEVNLNLTSPEFTNWSLVGRVNSPISVDLIKNSTSFGKNWISLYYNSSLNNALGLVSSVSYSDAVTDWDGFNQTSQGYISTGSPFPWIPPYIGINFPLEPEKGYEVSVNQSSTYDQS